MFRPACAMGGTDIALDRDDRDGEMNESDCERAGENTMRKGSPSKSGIELLLEKYAAIFRTPENLNHYSEEDYQAAERKFLKYALENGNIFLREKNSNP